VSDADPSLFILNKGDGDVTYILLYVDDILAFSQKAENVDSCKVLLKSHFAGKDLGEAHYFWACKLHCERCKWESDCSQIVK
jgi:hypothetical protein